MIELFLRQTKSPMRSIVNLCEQSGYRSAAQKEPTRMIFLLLTEVYLDWYAREIPMFAQVILEESAVVLADILWQVAEEYKLRSRCWELHCILDADILTLG